MLVTALKFSRTWRLKTDSSNTVCHKDNRCPKASLPTLHMKGQRSTRYLDCWNSPGDAQPCRKCTCSSRPTVQWWNSAFVHGQAAQLMHKEEGNVQSMFYLTAQTQAVNGFWCSGAGADCLLVFWTDVINEQICHPLCWLSYCKVHWAQD